MQVFFRFKKGIFCFLPPLFVTSFLCYYTSSPQASYSVVEFLMHTYGKKTYFIFFVC